MLGFNFCIEEVDAMNYVQKIIKQICEEKNIEFNLISKDWIMVLRKNKRIRYISGYKFGLNNQSSSIICDDKYALYDTLKLLNIPIIEHKIVFKNYDKKEVEDFFNKHNKSIVVKSNSGTCGLDIYHIEKIEELFKKIDLLLISNYSISLCPFYNIKNEYRTIILDGKVELFYGKKRPIVYGDGIKTIKELLCDFNYNYFFKIDDIKLNKVLKKDEKFMYSWQHNLSRGSIPFEEDNETLKEKIQSLAIKAFNILDLRFASVDIIELESGKILILEINSGVMIDNYAKYMKNGEEICKRIYSKAIDLMFK